MSYCRWSDSDIYAYETESGYCIHVSGNVGLALDSESFLFGEIEPFRAKMIELRDMGYDVPDYAIAQIDAEMKEGRSGTVSNQKGKCKTCCQLLPAEAGELVPGTTE